METNKLQEIPVDFTGIGSSAIGAVKQLVTSSEQLPISGVVFVATIGCIIVLRLFDAFALRKIIASSILAAGVLNALIGTRTAMPIDQEYPRLVMAFRGIAIAIVACCAYGLFLKTKFAKKFPVLQGESGGTMITKKSDIEGLMKEDDETKI